MQRSLFYYLRFIHCVQKKSSSTGQIAFVELNYDFSTAVEITQTIYFSTIMKQV